MGTSTHPDPHGQPDRTPIDIGEVWENPITRERAIIMERPWDNPEGRATAELTALVGARVVVEACVWHDWWNASDRDARVRVGVTPGERFVHISETFFGLARLGHTDDKGMPFPLQLASTAREFSDVLVFRSPPPAVQRVVFGTMAPIAQLRGYRATYPRLSRIVLASRT